MDNYRVNTPIGLIIFNRPEHTRRVLGAIRLVRPRRLLVVADGPRSDVSEDTNSCMSARNLLDTVDWDCEILVNYSEVNLGCRKRVATGLNWVFDSVDEAIILEDDCIPHPSFFQFCEELLERYRSDRRIMSISGNTFSPHRKRTSHSYRFSGYTHIWGWASWKRAWSHYDVGMSKWPAARDLDWLKDYLEDPRAVRYWSYIFQKAYEGLDTWDYAWMFACWMCGGLNIVPNANLVSNIGFGPGSTHTMQTGSKFANVPVEKMIFPLNHPPYIARDVRADDLTEEIMFSGIVNTLFERIRIRKKAVNRITV